MSLETTLIPSNSLMSRLETIVLDHLHHEDFDVETFARLAGMSRSELYRKIKKYSGKSVTQFIRDIRLRKSLELISTGEYTAYEVAYKVGFNSATYFNKCFKEKFGFTPGDSEHHTSEIETVLHTPPSSPEIPEKPSLRKRILFITGITLLAVAGVIFWLKMDSMANEKSPGTNEDITPAVNTEEPTAAAPKSSIAILPLLNWTGNADNDFICYGMTDAIINRLAGNSSLDHVSPMSSVIPYKDSVKALGNIADHLNVGSILYGSVQQAGSKLKFSMEFINTDNQEVYWQEDFVIDWEPEEAFRVQEEIADEVVKALGIYESPFIHSSNPSQPPTMSKKAYDFYLQGVYQTNIFTREAWESSIYFFDKAIEEDPEYIQAYLNRAYTWRNGGLIWSYTSQEEAWENSQRNLSKVLELDPENTFASYFLRDAYFYFKLNAADTIPEVPEITPEEQIKFNPDYAIKKGWYEEARDRNLSWLKKEPYNGFIYALLAINHYFLKEPDKAKVLLDENYDRYKNDINFLRESAKAWYFLAEYDKMKKAVQYFSETFDERPPIILWLRALVAEHDGNESGVAEELSRLREAYHKGESGSPAWFLALFEARKGNHEMALQWLNRAYAAREVELTWLAQEPDLAPLGSYPEYRALLDSMNFPPKARVHVKNAIITQN